MESLWRTSLSNFPPFEADREAGETGPPHGGAMSDSKGAPGPTATCGAAMGAEDLVGFVHLRMVYLICVNLTSLKKNRLDGEDLTLLAKLLLELSESQGILKRSTGRGGNIRDQ